MNHDIFISYTQPNRNEAFAIHDMFQVNKLKSWIAHSKDAGIPAGEYFEEPIVKAISHCKIFVLVYSDFANKSEHIINEIRHRTKGQKIIIIRLDDSVYHYKLSYYLKGSQYIDGRRDNWLNTLLNQVKKDVNVSGAEKYESTDKFLLSAGLEYLEKKLYQQATKQLNQYMSIEPADSFVRFALALSIIGGRKCRKLDGLEVKNLEKILLPVLNIKENDYIRLLLAIIKCGYYESNGLIETAPFIDELLNEITIETIKDEKAKMILSHLQDPENSVWEEFNRLYQL